MINLKVRKVGNLLGVVLPLEVTRRLHLEEGDRLFLTEAPEGGYWLTPYDPEFEAQMKFAEEGMARYHNALHLLAK